MKKRFLNLCKLWSFVSYCEWCGDYPKAVNTCRMIDETAKGHAVLNFFAKWLHCFFA